MNDARVTIEKVLACDIYDDPTKCLICCYREGGYSDIDCTDEHKIVTKVTIEILNPVPKTAKFFWYSIVGTEIQVWTNPKSVTLDGSYNKVSNKFSSEKDGREWARDILLAVIRKSQEAVIKAPEIIDVDFEYHRVGFVSSSPLILFEPQIDQHTLSFIKDESEAPDCFGNYHTCRKDLPLLNGTNLCGFGYYCRNIPKCFGNYCNNIEINCNDCIELYFNTCLKQTRQIKREEQKKSQKKKPDCFGLYHHSKFCHICYYINPCVKEQSERSKKPNCVTTYDPDNEVYKFCNDEDIESCKEETKNHFLVTRWYNGDIDLVTNLSADQGTQAYFELASDTGEIRKVDTLLLGKVVKSHQGSNVESNSSDPTPDPNHPPMPCIGLYHKISSYCGKCPQLDKCLKEQKNPTNSQEVDERPKCFGYYLVASETCQFCSWKSRCHLIFDGIRRGRS